MFLVYAGRLRAESEEDVGRLRAERDCLRALAVKDALVEIPLAFEGRNGCGRLATRLRRTRESMVFGQEGEGEHKRESVLYRLLFHPPSSMIGNGA